MAALAVGEQVAAAAPRAPFGVDAKGDPSVSLHFSELSGVYALAAVMRTRVHTRVHTGSAVGTGDSYSYLAVTAHGVQDGIGWRAWAHGELTPDPAPDALTMPDGAVWRRLSMDEHSGEAVYTLSAAPAPVAQAPAAPAEAPAAGQAAAGGGR